MAWHAALQLDYRHEAGRSLLRHSHSGPLRVLQTLYPEGEAICHNVLVHPPGGLVGGDTLDIAVQVGSGSHALITTPGASRYYRSDGASALQRSHLRVQASARLEWLPLEAICYSGCRAENHLTMELVPGAELLGWDITALGLPQAHLPFVQGSFSQHLELSGVWLERGRIDASDQRLLDSPAGLDGARCMASLFFVCGTALERTRRQQALEQARELLCRHPLARSASVTCPNAQVVLLRALAPLVEEATDLLRQVRAAWRQAMWQLPPVNPRVWAM